VSFDVNSTIWGVIILAILLAANAFFVAAEYALVSIRRTRVDELIQQGVAEATSVRKALENLEHYVAATQICITMAGLGLGWVGEPALSTLITSVVGIPLQGIDANARRAVSVSLSFLIVTYVTVVIGELIPKSVTLKYAERVALRVGRPVVFVGWLLRPFIWALNKTAELILRLIGLNTIHEIQSGYSVHELKLMVEVSEKIGAVENIEREMIHAVFDFGDLTAREVMVPRTEMIAVDADSPLHDLIQLAITHSYSKFPVFEGDVDHIIGIAHVKDLVRVQHKDRLNATIRGLMREALVVPATRRLDALLQEFRSKKQHLAIVLDEYGGTAGLVTLGDLMSQIVGKVNDQFDKSTPEIQRLPDGSALIGGMALIEEVNDHFSLNLKDENYDTIAGFVLGKLKRIAKVGDTVDANGARLKVEAMDGLRISRISLKQSSSGENANQLP